MGKKLILLFLMILSSSSAFSSVDQFFAGQMKNKKGCFIFTNVRQGKPLFQYGSERCQKRLPPMSTFKIVLSAMAYQDGYFNSPDQVIPWDGVMRSRKSLNKDQTPKSFIKNSALWVSRKMVGHFGKEKFRAYLEKYRFGNSKLTGDINSAWLSAGSIKISAVEQIDFLRRLWTGQLPISGDQFGKLKSTIFYKSIEGFNIYGKTGTGCIDPGCENGPGRQLGWFVGIMEGKDDTFVFALNFSDEQPRTGYAGPRARRMAVEFFESEIFSKAVLAANKKKNAPEKL